MHLLFIQDDIIQALGWTLVHSLWQGMLLAVMAGLIILLTRKSGAGLRYTLLVSLFCLFIGAAGFTFISQLHKARATLRPAVTVSAPGYNNASGEDYIISPVLNTEGQEANNRFTDRFVSYFNTHAPMVVLIWFIIFSAKLVKLLANLGYVQRIRHYKTHAPSGYWKRKLRRMAEGLLIRQNVQLLESEIVSVPVVVGFLKPVILIPIGLIAHLPAEQVEAILLHELAHIKRKDYFVNLLQSVAETIFFFNPAVLWLSSLIREERENCCDDIAVAGTGNKTAFLDALVSFQEYTSNAAGYGMAFPGRKNHLLNRVKRILHQKNKTLNTMEKSLLTFSIALILLLTLTTARQAQGQTDTPPAEKSVKKDRLPVIMRDTLPDIITPPPPPVPAAAPVRHSVHAPRAAEAAQAASAPPPPAPPLPEVKVDALAAAPTPRPALETVTVIGYALAAPAAPAPAPVPPVPPVIMRDTVKPGVNEFPHLSCDISDDGGTKTESVEATSRDGKKYKYTKLNDALTFLSVDGVEITKDHYTDYQPVIDRIEEQRVINYKRALDRRNINLKVKELKLQSYKLNLQQQNLRLKNWVQVKTMQNLQRVAIDGKIASAGSLYFIKQLADNYSKKVVPFEIYRYKRKQGFAIKNLCVVPCEEVKLNPSPVYKINLSPGVKKIRVDRNETDNIQRQKELARALISDLVKDNIIKKAGNIVWFGLTDSEFIVNGEKQPAEVLDKYKAAYLTHPGLGLFYGPVKMSGAGFFIDKDDL